MAEKKYFGIYQGIVTNLNDPEKRGRIKVKCPDVLGTTESAWCDPMIQVAYDNGGDFCMPQKKEAVWLMFIAGDSNRPVWMGGWWQSKMTPIGEKYTKLEDLRIINYADCTIIMKNGVIDIHVGNSDYDLRINDGKVTVNGNLRVNGSISAWSVYAGTIHATKDPKTGNGGFLVADEETTTKEIPFTTHTHGGVKSGSSDTRKPNP